jgi:NAD(P) transhydrogenase subunit alpha
VAVGSITEIYRWLCLDRVCAANDQANRALNKCKGAIMPADFISNLYVFILAGFVGFELIKRVSPLLHTPLMALTNALDAIVVVAAIIIAGRHETRLTTVLGAIAVAASFSNMVGGFLITDRMLRMFKSGRSKQS